MEKTKILFVCSQNKLRSLTAEKMYENSNYAVKSAGTEKGARTRVTAGMIGWADLIFVMEKRHRDRLRSKFRESLAGKKIICLHIPDNYEYMEPELIEILESKLSPYIEVPNNQQDFIPEAIEPEVIDVYE
ncbi:hypothetical protein [Kamptonema sp. UHCC 0994]|uniref:low molecular weight protein tyrosine phosphatase family protein n=1 Tax=Kamptonema sp. UHCC 0994 TaxID=3031329 RepID=UPI0023B9D2F6|nr:hypothetical protein [Kamptonema sp. UHCC 0994]MDF0554316.1 hypothetical protein [Kamptonema sp. UHCC 0994]